MPEGAGGLRGDLLKELVFSTELRPRIPAAVLDRFQRKLHRTWPGYAPPSAGELVEWVKERLAIPGDEWRDLLDAVGRDVAVAAVPGTLAAAGASGLAGGAGAPSPVAALVDAASDRIVQLDLPGREGGLEEPARVVCAFEALPRLLTALGLAPEAVCLTSLHSPGLPTDEQLAQVGARMRRALAELSAPATGEDEGDPLAAVLAEWLRFYGPVPSHRLAVTFGLDDDRIRDLLETLTASETIVIDQFRDGDDAPLELCDAENLERLLRLMRAAARPEFRPLPIERLPQFLAAWQGLATPADGVEGLQAALERLFGYPAPARLWETDLLPARLEPYYPSWLDSLLQESDLVWWGCGRERLTFVFPDDLELLREGAGAVDAADLEPDAPRAAARAAPAAQASQRRAGPRDRPTTGIVAGPSELPRDLAGTEASTGATAAPDLAALFPDPRGHYTLDDLARHSGRDPGALTEQLWQLAWEGRVTNTAFAAVRQGILNRFRPAEPAADRWVSERRRQSQRRARRHRFERWRSSRPFAGDWYRLDGIAGEEPESRDALDLEELNKDRVRLLLHRYGVLFRELLERELPALRWGRLFRTLRLMELSGEVLAGQFFDDVPGLQFASPAAFRRLEEGLPDDAVVWMSAADPASPAGLGLDALQGRYPARLPSNHLVFHGPRLVVASRRHAAELDLHAEPDHPLLGDYLAFLKVLLTRQFDPRRGLTVETINGEPAATTPYAPRLAGLFQATREGGALKLRRSYGES